MISRGKEVGGKKIQIGNGRVDLKTGALVLTLSNLPLRTAYSPVP